MALIAAIRAGGNGSLTFPESKKIYMLVFEFKHSLKYLRYFEMPLNYGFKGWHFETFQMSMLWGHFMDRKIRF